MFPKTFMDGKQGECPNGKTDRHPIPDRGSVTDTAAICLLDCSRIISWSIGPRSNRLGCWLRAELVSQITRIESVLGLLRLGTLLLEIQGTKPCLWSNRGIGIRILDLGFASLQLRTFLGEERRKTCFRWIQAPTS